jgi:hypothetical protein
MSNRKDLFEHQHIHPIEAQVLPPTTPTAKAESDRLQLRFLPRLTQKRIRRHSNVQQKNITIAELSHVPRV